MPAAATLKGFEDPVQDSQVAFRIILDALANPGTASGPIRVAAPAPLSAAAGAVLLTLADYETPVFLSPALDRPQVRDWVRFATGAPLVGAGDAAFLLIAGGDPVPALDEVRIGEEDYPDRSATLVIEVEAFTDEHRFTGPGIESEIRFGAVGPDDGFWRSVAENHALYPLGVDFLFTCDEALAALPRSSLIGD